MVGAGGEVRLGCRADIVVAVVVSVGPCEGVEAGPLTTRVRVEQATGWGNYSPVREPISQTQWSRLLAHSFIWYDISSAAAYSGLTCYIFLPLLLGEELQSVKH